MHHTGVVFVKAFTRFAAQHAASQALRRDDTGAVPGFFIVLVVNRLHDRVRDIKCGQVHQLKRPEFEADLVAQNTVNGGKVCNAFADDSQRFGTVATACVVDDKTGCVLGQHCGVAHLFGVI